MADDPTFAWLIEDCDAPRGRWWSGFGYSYEANEAVRFARKEDAEKAILTALASTPYRLIATEHGWHGCEWRRASSEVSGLEEKLSLAGVEVRSYIDAAVTLQEKNAQLRQRIAELEAAERVREEAEVAVCPEDVGFAEYIKTLEAQLAEANIEKQFTAAFADKLKEFGTVERLIESYSASKMQVRDLESQLKERDAYIQLLASNAERIGKLEKQLEEKTQQWMRAIEGGHSASEKIDGLEQRLARARQALVTIAGPPDAFEKLPMERLALEALRDLEAQ